MTDNEDPAAPRPADDLEDWLSDLRTEEDAGPPAWAEESPRAEEAERPSSVGRHRAPE